jgi:hypothetical protein
MPIKISMSGSAQSGEPWTTYIGVATGITTRMGPAGTVDLTARGGGGGAKWCRSRT